MKRKKARMMLSYTICAMLFTGFILIQYAGILRMTNYTVHQVAANMYIIFYVVFAFLTCKAISDLMSILIFRRKKNGGMQKDIVR